MNINDYSILIKEFSERLPHDLYFSHCSNVHKLKSIELDGKNTINNKYSIEICYPFLRPMSSMTEEEKRIICSMNMLSDTELSDRLNYQKMYVQNYTIETFDLFNAHHLDYRGLIPMGLALPAPKEMYNIK